MKRTFNLASILAGSTILGTLSYLIIKPKDKLKKKNKKKLFVTDESSNDYFI